MAKKYGLKQVEVHTAHELGNSMVLALLLKLALDVQPNRDAAAKEIRDGVRQLIAATNAPDIPPARMEDFLKAATDRAVQIVDMAAGMQRHIGPDKMQ